MRCQSFWLWFVPFDLCPLFSLKKVPHTWKKASNLSQITGKTLSKVLSYFTNIMMLPLLWEDRTFLKTNGWIESIALLLLSTKYNSSFVFIESYLLKLIFFWHKNCWGHLPSCTNIPGLYSLIYFKTNSKKAKEELHSLNVVFLSLIFSFPSGTAFQRITQTTPNLFLILNITQPNGECYQPS